MREKGKKKGRKRKREGRRERKTLDFDILKNIRNFQKAGLKCL